MIAPTRISIDAVHAPVYWKLTSTLTTWPPPSWPTPPLSSDDDRRGSSKRFEPKSRPLLDHPTRASRLVYLTAVSCADALDGSSCVHCPCATLWRA